MNKYANDKKENKRLSESHGASQIPGGPESNFQFSDNRPEALQQKKLSEMANNRPQQKQALQLKAMMDAATTPLQLYTKDKTTNRVVQGAWVNENGKKTWRDKAPSGLRYRTTGELKWASWWKPREHNELLEVYEQNPDQTGVDQIDTSTSSDLFLLGERIDGNAFRSIGLKTNLNTLEFKACKFDNLNSSQLSNLNSLTYLCINNPNAFSFVDNIAGIASMGSLKTLKLIRCDFIHNDTAYSNLGAMTQLSYLDLTRTLTKEKAHGDEFTEKKFPSGRTIRQVKKISSAIMTSLMNLVTRLNYLNIENCTALSTDQIQALVDQGHISGCLVRNSEGVIPSPRARFEELLDRIP